MKLSVWNIFFGYLIILTVLYSALSILRHNHFDSGGFDLGLYDQSVWQYSKFLWPYNTVKERFILGDHLALTMPLIAPMFWVINDVRVLFVIQAAWLCLSSVGIFLIARLRKFSDSVALAVAIIYSLFYGIQFAVYFDFHPVTLGVGLLVWVAYFLEASKKKLLVISIALLLLTQENMGIALASLGFIYIFHKKFRKQGLLFILIGIPVSIMAAKIVSHLSPGGFQYWPQISHNPVEIVREFFDSPEKKQVWLYSFSWFSFLPLLSPGAVLAVLLDLAQYFVTGPEFARMWSPYMHHRAILAPLLALGTIDALGVLRTRRINVRYIAVLFVLTACVQQYTFHFALNKLTKRAYWQEEQWMRDNENLVQEIPEDYSVASQQNLIPHLSHRKEIYLVWPRLHDYDDNRCGEPTCWWLDFPTQARYLVLDTRPNQTLTQTLEASEHFLEAIKNMEQFGSIQVEMEVGHARLYRVKKT